MERCVICTNLFWGACKPRWVFASDGHCLGRCHTSCMVNAKRQGRFAYSASDREEARRDCWYYDLRARVPGGLSGESLLGEILFSYGHNTQRNDAQQARFAGWSKGKWSSRESQQAILAHYDALCKHYAAWLATVPPDDLSPEQERADPVPPERTPTTIRHNGTPITVTPRSWEYTCGERWACVTEWASSKKPYHFFIEFAEGDDNMIRPQTADNYASALALALAWVTREGVEE